MTIWENSKQSTGDNSVFLPKIALLNVDLYRITMLYSLAKEYGGRYSGKFSFLGVRYMGLLLSHISAFEYWRIVGMHGVVAPEKSNIQAAPSPAPVGQSEWKIAQVGQLSLPLHCLVSKKRHQLPNLFYHYASRPLPRGSVYVVAEGVCVVSPELALLQVASLVSMSELAGLMTEFCGHYSPAEFEAYGLMSRAPLTSLARLESFASRASYLNDLDKFKQAIRYAFNRSRSPMETGLALLLSLPPRYGGYSLSGLELNKEIFLKSSERKAFCVDVLRPDICWDESKLCVEYDSAVFHADASRVVNDAQRKNAFASAGYVVSTFTKTQLQSWNKTDLFAEQLAKALGKRIRGNGAEQRGKLRKQLFSVNSVLKKQYGVSMRVGQGVIRLGN